MWSVARPRVGTAVTLTSNRSPATPTTASRAALGSPRISSTSTSPSRPKNDAKAMPFFVRPAPAFPGVVFFPFMPGNERAGPRRSTPNGGRFFTRRRALRKNPPNARAAHPGAAFRLAKDRAPRTVRAMSEPTKPHPGLRATDALLAPLIPHMRALDAFLDAQIDEFEPSVRDLVRYTFGHRGKRLRPVLVFFSGWDGEEPSADLIRAAAIVEMVHLATLVHDDILDGASLRHSSETAAARYGAHAAVLLGDALFAQALKLTADFPTVEVCRVVATALRDVCSGEICQTFARGDDALSLDAYRRIIKMKTADLFEVSCLLGAMFSGRGHDYRAACAEYGSRLGVAYQIFDDLADFVGDSSKIGKTLGTDLASGKFTLPLLLWLNTLSAQRRAVELASIRSGALSIDAVSARLRESGALRASRDNFNAELAAAEAAIAAHKGAPSAPYLAALTAFVRAQMERLPID